MYPDIVDLRLLELFQNSPTAAYVAAGILVVFFLGIIILARRSKDG